jgi:hypothetical protein
MPRIQSLRASWYSIRRQLVNLNLTVNHNPPVSVAFRRLRSHSFFSGGVLGSKGTPETMNLLVSRWVGSSLRNKLRTQANFRGATPACHPFTRAVSKGGLRFESPGVPRSGLRHVRQGKCSPQGGFWGRFGGRHASGFSPCAKWLQDQAFMAAADRSRDPCQDTGNDAAAHSAHFRRASRRREVRWRGAPPPSNGLRSCPKRFSRSVRNVARVPARASALGPSPRLGVAL